MTRCKGSDVKVALDGEFVPVGIILDRLMRNKEYGRNHQLGWAFAHHLDSAEFTKKGAITHAHE